MNLVLTIAIGAEYQALASLTHPTIKAYADKIGAEFAVIEKTRLTSPHWEKCEIADLLYEYDRIMYLDTDLIVRDDCPNLFDVVPDGQLGMFNEAPFTHRSRELMIDCCRAYGVQLAAWDGRYFNSGVIVASQEHRDIFAKPDLEYCSFYEQTWLNMQLALRSAPMYELPYQLNRMTCLDSFTGEHRLASYIVHYAGAPNTQMLMPIIRRDLEAWESGQSFQRHLHVIVSGGLGDQVQAEPAIRFMARHIYPDADITVTSHWPELFTHLPVRSLAHQDFRPEWDTPYYAVHSLPSPETIHWQVVSNLLCHTVDYCSMALLRRTLPMADKHVSMPACQHAVHALCESYPVKSMVAVHPGRHWATKTFPVEWWQAVIDGMVDAGLTVGIVGQNDETRGTVPVVAPAGAIDLRDKLGLRQFIALLSLAPVLVSNDSSPIHLAGAFENHIILIPSCKHPEHVLPFRHGNPYWNARALYKRLTIDDVSARPTDVHGSSADFVVTDWERYLPEPAIVIEAALHAVQWPLREVTYGNQ